MFPFTTKQLKNEADLKMATTPGDHRKIAFIYGAVALGAGLISLLVDFITGLMIENTGGLSDIGTRTILETVNYLFPLAVNILLPLWMLGLMRTALQLARQEKVTPRNLTQGFPRWGVMLRLTLFQGITYFAIGYLTLQVSTILFSMTPLSANVSELLLPYMEDPALLETAMADSAVMLSLVKAMLPVLILWVVLMIAIMIPVAYGMRLSFYRILDDDRPGALLSIGQSRKMMKGNKLALFKLDLSFWWYYLLQILLAVLLELPIYLAGSVLPISADVLTLIAAVLQAAGGLWLYYKYLMKIEVCYALFYDTLYESHKTPPAQPQFFNWQQ